MSAAAVASVRAGRVVTEVWPGAVALGRLRLVPTETSADASRGTRVRTRIPPEALEPPPRPAWTVTLVRRELA